MCVTCTEISSADLSNLSLLGPGFWGTKSVKISWQVEPSTPDLSAQKYQSNYWQNFKVGLSTRLQKCRGRPLLSLTFGMFFAFTRSSTSNRTSIGTPNSNRSLIIRSTRSRVFIWSVGAALCFLPRGVGQLLNMTSSMILGVRERQGLFSNKEQRCLLSILQPASIFSNITNFSRHLGGRSVKIKKERKPALPDTQIRSLWPVAQTRRQLPQAPQPPQSNPSAWLNCGLRRPPCSTC